MRSQMSKAVAKALPTVLIIIVTAACVFALVRSLDPEELSFGPVRFKAKSSAIGRLPSR